MDIKPLINPHTNNIKSLLLDPVNLYHINTEIVYLLTSKKFLFDKFVSIDGVLSTSLSIRNRKPQIIITPGGLIGDISKKTAIFITDIPSHEVLNNISLIRTHGGICDKCIAIMDTEDMTDQFKNNKVELYSLVKKSDYGLL